VSFEEVYQLHVDRVYRFVYRRVRDQATAEDITSDVFLRALQALGRYQDRGQMLAWLLQIARRAVIDHYRARPTESIDALDLGAGGFEERVLRRVEVRRIGALIDRLPALQREAMVLYFRDDMSHRAIATAMGRSEGAVRILVHRGVTAIREAA
jgi:RNA polymerase sigma-70 factor (ECF subfamily)